MRDRGTWEGADERGRTARRSSCESFDACCAFAGSGSRYWFHLSAVFLPCPLFFARGSSVSASRASSAIFFSGGFCGRMSFSGWRRWSLFMALTYRRRRTLNADGERRFDAGEERGDDFRIELRAGAPLDLRDRLFEAEGGPVEPVGSHRVEGVGHEDDACAARDVLPGKTVGVAVVVPALVVMEDPVGDRVDAEALEHAVADLRMALEQEPLRVGQCCGLAQDLLRDRELAEVVQAPREARQLDVVGGQAESRRDLRGERRDALGMAAGVGVARVDGAGERRGRAEACDAVDAACNPPELRQLGDVGAGGTALVLAVLLRPGEGAVGEADERVSLTAVLREGGDAGTDRDRACLAELRLCDALRDRARGLERLLLVHVREQDRELVTAEAERLAALA